MLHGKVRRDPLPCMDGVDTDADGAALRADKQRENLPALAADADHPLFAAVAMVKCLHFFIDVHTP